MANDNKTFKMEPRLHAHARPGHVAGLPRGLKSMDSPTARPSQESLGAPVAGGSARSISANPLSHGRKRHHKRRISRRAMQGMIAALTIIAIAVVLLLILRF